MFSVVLSWSYRRHFLVSFKKTKLLAVGPNWQSFIGQSHRFVWAPEGIGPAARVNHVFKYIKSSSYLGYLFHASLSDDPNYRVQLSRAYAEIDTLRMAVAITQSIRRDHLLSAYRLFILGTAL